MNLIPSKTMCEEIPPLQNGDHLTVAEFERRYSAMPELKKAELIEGVVYMGSPVSEAHSSSHLDLAGWIAMYKTNTPGVRGGDNGTLRLQVGENMPQPDAYLRILPEHGGKSKIDKKGYVVGAPELVAEIAVSSVSYDLHQKLKVYERNGVREYIVWRVEDEKIDWFVRTRGRFQTMKARDGVHKSKTFPGLWLDVAALLQGEAKVFRVLQEGLPSPEHLHFVSRLGKK